MKYYSTRSSQQRGCSFSSALLAGLAPDGGLYVPQKIPHFSSEELAAWPCNLSLSDLAIKIFPAWIGEKTLEDELTTLAPQIFNFETPLSFLNHNTAILELFHGPTAAFKDIGARFLAAVFATTAAPEKRVLVATSGDTGGAVAAAFHHYPAIEVVILYPEAKVSPMQEMQLTTWGKNVQAFCVRGDFDDCQRMVKELLLEPAYAGDFLSANSINLGRLLPQTLYYAQASLSYQQQQGRTAGVIVPTGNLGNGVAALWAKAMGFPIGEVVLATNSNQAIAQYFASAGKNWTPLPTITTLANAMDVGNPSNMERLLHLYREGGFKQLQTDVSTIVVNDQEILLTMKKSYEQWKQLFCPHTATALFAREVISQQRKHDDWIVVATAHPAKFKEIVEKVWPSSLLSLPLPSSLQSIIARPQAKKTIPATVSALKHYLPK
ncbi:MAG: threonine synthase [Oligoflexia bacterium]|nr:threonine synthase [Oligoflexia bacterium]